MILKMATTTTTSSSASSRTTARNFFSMVMITITVVIIMMGNLSLSKLTSSSSQSTTTTTETVFQTSYYNYYYCTNAEQIMIETRQYTPSSLLYQQRTNHGFGSQLYRFYTPYTKIQQQQQQQVKSIPLHQNRNQYQSLLYSSITVLRGGGANTNHQPRSSSTIQIQPFWNTPTIKVNNHDNNNINHHGSDTSSSSSTTMLVKEQIDAFLTRDSRNTFIARVYAILAIQLIVTAITVHIFGTNPSITEWIRYSKYGPIIPLLSLFLSTIAWITMSVSTSARRIAPMKWQLLSLFTIGEALSVGFISSLYHYRSVITSMIVVAISTSCISLYTIKQRNPKYDLSQYGATLSSLGLIFVLYGIIQLLQSTHVLPPDLLPYNDMIYGCIGSVLFSGYLAYHTKLITANKFAKYKMNEKDYIFGASYVYAL